MAESSQQQAKKYRLIKPLNYKGRLVDPAVVKNPEVELYVDQAERLKKGGVIQ